MVAIPCARGDRSGADDGRLVGEGCGRREWRDRVVLGHAGRHRCVNRVARRSEVFGGTHEGSGGCILVSSPILGHRRTDPSDVEGRVQERERRSSVRVRNFLPQVLPGGGHDPGVGAMIGAGGNSRALCANSDSRIGVHARGCLRQRQAQESNVRDSCTPRDD